MTTTPTAESIAAIADLAVQLAIDGYHAEARAQIIAAIEHHGSSRAFEARREMREEAAADHFETVYDEHEGVKLSCKAIVPGKTLHDMMRIFEEAAKSEGANHYSANPSDWPTVRGIQAVIKATKEAIRALPDKPETVGGGE